MRGFSLCFSTVTRKTKNKKQNLLNPCLRWFSTQSTVTAVGVTVLIAVFLCLPSPRAEMGAGAVRRPGVTRRCIRGGQLAPGTETVGKCLLN